MYHGVAGGNDDALIIVRAPNGQERMLAFRLGDWILCLVRSIHTRRARRIRTEAFSVAFWLASAEDTILVQLEWVRADDSERRVRDVTGSIAVRGAELDTAYIDPWADQLGVADRWRALHNAGSRSG